MHQKSRIEPSPAEISAACREIQASWTDKDWHARRAVAVNRDWLPPGIERICHLALNVRRIPDN
jgi:hypothetical protein